MLPIDLCPTKLFLLSDLQWLIVALVLLCSCPKRPHMVHSSRSRTDADGQKRVEYGAFTTPTMNSHSLRNAAIHGFNRKVGTEPSAKPRQRRRQRSGVGRRADALSRGLWQTSERFAARRGRAAP